VNTPKATILDAKKLFEARGLKIMEPPPVQIGTSRQSEGEMSSSDEEEEKMQVPYHTRIP
jgi:hypothetical protein